MNYFEGIEEIEEFDWFPETDTSDDYESIVDLKNKAENENTYEEIDNKYEYGEIEDDMLMWHYTGGLQETMNSVFSNVYEKICGAELDVNSKYLHDYTDKLSEKAVVVQSGICDTRNIEKNRSMIESKIKACLCENGSLIAVVSNDTWENIRYDEESAFLDNGMRVIQIIGMRDDEIVINDYLDEKGMGVSVPSEQFCQMHGILVEVYK